jgi:hypothetical protein
MKKGYLYCIALLAPVVLAGEAGAQTMQSHSETANMVKASSATGDFKASIVQLDTRYPSEDAKQELLYNMERGELLRLDRQYEPSTAAFLAACYVRQSARLIQSDCRADNEAKIGNAA